MANLCQNPLCHLHNTNDRLKGNKYQTRKVYNNSYHDYFCTLNCLNDFLAIHINRIINFIGLKENPSMRNKEDQDYYAIARSLNTDGYWYNTTTRRQVFEHLNNSNQT
mgnify:CR=1 FL=1